MGEGCNGGPQVVRSGAVVTGRWSEIFDTNPYRGEERYKKFHFCPGRYDLQVGDGSILADKCFRAYHVSKQQQLRTNTMGSLFVLGIFLYQNCNSVKGI